VAPDGTLAITIAKGNDPITISVQGATLESITPNLVPVPSKPPTSPPTTTPQMSPSIALETPIRLPARDTDSSYTLKFSDLSPEQTITFSISDDTSKANDPSYQPEVETVRVEGSWQRK
jgi:hypothetical protein